MADSNRGASDAPQNSPTDSTASKDFAAADPVSEFPVQSTVVASVDVNLGNVPFRESSSPPDAKPSSPAPENSQAYQTALDYLYSRINYEKIGNTPYNSGNYRLDRMRHLLQLLGNPHLDYPVVHVAGTKGKGTTCTLIADCLRACGYRTGLYTSPHLLRLEERIQFEGRPCEAEELAELTNRVRQAAEHLERTAGGGKTTFFELTTAMGFLHFSFKKADAVVLEVGLGGRLDSTNVCQPIVSVITSISLDHQAQLGNTLQAIAYEKAGIIKPRVPVVCVTRGAEPRAAIEEVAQLQNSPLSLIDRDFCVQWRPLTNGSQRQVAEAGESNSMRAEVMFEYPLDKPACEEPDEVAWLDGPPSKGTVWTTQLLGRHQADNIAAALATFEVLRKLNWNLPLDSIRQAICESHPLARLQIVDSEPLSILDSAHNPASILAGLEALREHFDDRPLTVVFAASRDKDWQLMLEVLMSRSHRIILTAYRENPRALPLNELNAQAQAIRTRTEGNSADVVQSDSPLESWSIARALTAEPGIVYATGSFFLAAELLAAGVSK